METHLRNQQILMVTPVPACLTCRAVGETAGQSTSVGGSLDIAATLTKVLHRFSVDIHLAVPNYRLLLGKKNLLRTETERYCPRKYLPAERIHLAQDRSFYYCEGLSADASPKNICMALAFQREVMNRIIPYVRPDLIHCCDWCTGLIPPMCRSSRIPCVFTICNLNTARLPLSDIEDCGIDAAAFWQDCYFSRMPDSYEETRESNPVDFLLSAVFASDYVITCTPDLLEKIRGDQGGSLPPDLRKELENKFRSGHLTGMEAAEAYEHMLGISIR